MKMKMKFNKIKNVTFFFTLHFHSSHFFPLHIRSSFVRKFHNTSILPITNNWNRGGEKNRILGTILARTFSWNCNQNQSGQKRIPSVPINSFINGNSASLNRRSKYQSGVARKMTGTRYFHDPIRARVTNSY